MFIGRIVFEKAPMITGSGIIYIPAFRQHTMLAAGARLPIKGRKFQTETLPGILCCSNRLDPHNHPQTRPAPRWCDPWPVESPALFGPKLTVVFSGDFLKNPQ